MLLISSNAMALHLKKNLKKDSMAIIMLYLTLITIVEKIFYFLIPNFSIKALYARISFLIKYLRKRFLFPTFVNRDLLQT